MKISISMSEALLAEVDSMAESLSLSRSSYIALACSQHIKQEKLVSQLPELYKAVNQLRQTVEIADSKALLIDKK